VTKRGIPAITVCSTAFIVLGRKQLKALGCENHPIAIIPHPFGISTREQVKSIAEKCVDDIARIAIDPKAGTPTGAQAVRLPASAKADRIEVPEDSEEFDLFCIERRWSDGFPLRPPTLDRVERMIQASGREAHELIAIVQPGFGAATVEGIAINAVMAGCRPEYINTLIAAVEAITDRRFNLQGIQATTNPATPMIIVNGPEARALGVNGHLNCLGQGHWANATLGRALRLVLQNIGGTLPGEMDRATQGQPGKYSFCFAENEADSPWEPLHVERGFEINDSTVTLVGAAGTVNFNTHAKDAADLLKVFADSICFPTNNDYYFGGEPWLLISPEHAEILHREGLSKKQIKSRLWHQSQLSVDRLAAKDRMRLQHTRGAELGVFTDSTQIPISIKPEEVSLIVAGGPGTHSVHVPTFGHTRSVTRRIKTGVKI
jgi:hypothetical protein